MQVNWTSEQWGEVLTSLEYTKRKFENYTDYPSYEFKCARVAEIKAIIDELRRAFREQKEAARANR